MKQYQKMRYLGVWSLLLAWAVVLPAGAVPSGESAIPPSGCSGFCADTPVALTTDDVRRVIAQAVHEAQARRVRATVAVVDRVGNVLGVFRTADGEDFPLVTIDSGRNPPVEGGLEGKAVIPDTLAAIAKAITGAYLSSEGNAFTTRTASQIIQQHFNPGELNQVGGPLFGVQFSQLPCSDLSARFTAGAGVGFGPKRSPLGLAADSGGLPLYKNGTPVGAVGVISDGIYGLDLLITDSDRDIDELIAVAGTFGYAAPKDRRANRITADGKTLRFSDVDMQHLAVSPEQAPTLESYINSSVGRLVPVTHYFDGAILAGTAFGQAASGIVPAEWVNPGLFTGLDAFVLVNDQGKNRYPPIAGTDGLLTATEVTVMLQEALAVANHSRAQIRRPTGSPARVTISVVDSAGSVLGLVRTRDAPVFGIDVSLQKARSALFFSHPEAATELSNAPEVIFRDDQAMPTGQTLSLATYVEQARAFFGPDALTGNIAMTETSVGNLARPFFPDGLTDAPPGPFSNPFPAWSPFTNGLQLDMIANQVFNHVFSVVLADPTLDAAQNCTGISRLANGIQIFSGSVPIYRGNQLIGGIGISGDGIDQDAMVAFLGVHNAGLKLNNSLHNAPAAIRADQLAPFGVRLRYVQCPQSPFIDSDDQNVCEGK